jgi:hypothetical protein
VVKFRRLRWDEYVGEDRKKIDKKSIRSLGEGNFKKGYTWKPHRRR